MSSCLTTHKLTFCYGAAPEPLFRDLDLHFPQGWTGIVGPNGSGKTTFLLLATGALEPTSGIIRRPGEATYCPQRTDEPPLGFSGLLAATDAAAARMRARLAIEADWADRWGSLSHGERKRAQIAAALLSEPALLAVDEPTNHLDALARELLGRELASFRGVGLLVSHDRELLDRLSRQCLFLDPPIMRPGSYSQGACEARRERIARRERYLEAVRTAERLGRERVRRRQEASQASRRRSKRHLGIHDSDGKEKIDRARISGKDGQAGRLVRQLEGRERHAAEHAAGAYAPAERSLRFWLPGSVYQGDAVARMPAGRIPLGDGRLLNHPELHLGAADRIALCGPNGSGKSTLVRAILGALPVPRERVVYMPQEIPAEQARDLSGRVRALGRERLGHLMTVVADLGSDPRRLLATELPSPGETRKLLLALGVTGEPWLIVMDEPTNHLDLPSIELLERALADCPSSLLLVSHDLRFLDAVGCARWSIADGPGGHTLVR